VPSGNPPRTQLAFSIVQLTHIFTSLGLIQPKILIEFKNAADVLKSEKEAIHAEAKKVAQFILHKDLIIYSKAKDEAIAVRARQQFNENAKILCSHHVIPEMTHNELVGWAGGKPSHAVLFIHTSGTHPQNAKRFDFSKEVIQTKTEAIYHLNVPKNTQLVESLYLINIIDWASLYLSELMEVDAIEIAVIDKLKSSLVN
jgi:glucose/mannose-6-phosphate isomerase